MATPSPLVKFRELMKRPRFIPALGIWDPYTARVAEALGIECVHIGGYQLGAHYVTSEPLVTLTELATTTRYVTAAVRIPVIVDAGAGSDLITHGAQNKIAAEDGKEGQKWNGGTHD